MNSAKRIIKRKGITSSSNEVFIAEVIPSAGVACTITASCKAKIDCINYVLTKSEIIKSVVPSTNT